MTQGRLNEINVDILEVELWSLSPQSFRQTLTLSQELTKQDFCVNPLQSTLSLDRWHLDMPFQRPSRN